MASRLFKRAKKESKEEELADSTRHIETVLKITSQQLQDSEHSRVLERILKEAPGIEEYYTNENKWSKSQFFKKQIFAVLYP